jgi:RecB family exonuclease
MPVLEPPVTAHALTGAFRPVTSALLAETYLVPRAAPCDLETLLEGTEGPWSESLKIAPREATAAVARGLRALALATPQLSPGDVQLAALDPDSRIARHLSALVTLWRDHPDVLPDDLRVAAHVIASPAEAALERLALVDPEPCAFASPAERTLHRVLRDHHGLVPEQQRQEWHRRQVPLLAGAPGGSSLHRAQSALAGCAVAPGPLDETLAFFALRDMAEEARFAAARAQRLIDAGCAPQEIALLVPDEADYHAHLASAFAALGVPLSGLPRPPDRRDLAGEALLHLLLCLQSPAPAMALASLYVSPLMPWPAATGDLLAREVMRGRFDPRAVDALTGRARRLFRLLRDGVAPRSPALRAALDEATACLTDRPDHRDDIAQILGRLPVLRALLAGEAPPDWPQLFRAAAPLPPVAPPAERFVEGVGVFTEAALPWRSARHLIALGMAGTRWPRPVPASALFLDGELALLQRTTGLAIETRGARLQRRLERLHRQLLAATGTLTLLRPVFGPDGSRKPPAAALSLIARTIGAEGKGIEDSETLFVDLRGLPPDRWPCAHHRPAPLPAGPALPASGVLHIGRDLLRTRLEDDGRMRPQSPSRLEALLVSPLAWTLAEFGAEPVTWAPETLDVMLAGTLAHDVLEHLFPKDQQLPSPEAIATGTPDLLAGAIRKRAPFLQRAIWAVEREGLARDIRTAALAWRDTLAGLGAEVIDNELPLAGEALGIRLRGRADCLLRLPDGALVIVDHKKSGTARRRARMEAGWDLQLGLYRAMLLRPEATGAVLCEALRCSPQIGVAYHLINDQGVLLEGVNVPPGVATVMEGDISAAAIDGLTRALAEVGAGRVRLNTEGDRAFFEKTAKLAPYALDASPLVARFLIADAEAAEGREPADA